MQPIDKVAYDRYYENKEVTQRSGGTSGRYPVGSAWVRIGAYHAYAMLGKAGTIGERSFFV